MGPLPIALLLAVSAFLPPPAASRRNPDGSVSFLTIAPGIQGLGFVAGAGAKKTLVIRDAQHEYVFEEP